MRLLHHAAFPGGLSFLVPVHALSSLARRGGCAAPPPHREATRALCDLPCECRLPDALMDPIPRRWSLPLRTGGNAGASAAAKLRTPPVSDRGEVEAFGSGTWLRRTDSQDTYLPTLHT